MVRNNSAKLLVNAGTLYIKSVFFSRFYWTNRNTFTAYTDIFRPIKLNKNDSIIGCNHCNWSILIVLLFILRHMIRVCVWSILWTILTVGRPILTIIIRCRGDNWIIANVMRSCVSSDWITVDLCCNFDFKIFPFSKMHFIKKKKKKKTYSPLAKCEQFNINNSITVTIGTYKL